MDDFLGSLANKDYRKGINDESIEVEGKHYIGEPAWQIYTARERHATYFESKIIQTVVSEIYHDNTVRLMKQDRNEPVYFSYEKALEAYNESLEWIVSHQQEALEDAKAYAEKAKTEIIEEKTLTSDDYMGSFFDDKDTEVNPEMVLPKQKFSIGQTVYLVATDETRTIMSGSKRVGWKVVKSKIEKIQLYTNLDNPRIHYDLDTKYRFDESMMFATVEEAKAKLTDLVNAKISQFHEIIADMEKDVETIETNKEGEERNKKEMKKFFDKKYDKLPRR